VIVHHRLKHKVAVVRRLLSNPVGDISADDLVDFRMVQIRPRTAERKNPEKSQWLLGLEEPV
jgi:hypothetical protein